MTKCVSGVLHFKFPRLINCCVKTVRIRTVQAAHFIYSKNTLTIPSTKLLYTRTSRVMTVCFAHAVYYLYLALGINRDYLREQHYPVNTLMEKVNVYCAAETEYL